ncbi:SDR family NAD(P)-dependent oxidoreductase [Kribbella shirazensis]|jgi:NAD(P)-dependent dehydrogenase (short-subunit alcohol dehydrogenase family)|uniref:NAD(P)-dependent dehydrogenase (Short-subunit alcohol dehydrogenase family) n=1 Tax=Kribbella shirazensis TaxID=1105143 RepID=A0A7X5VHE4_9ACTN|nr:SDR family NAD(P)-dependent oxidoreductase [Kribbella shirazensis]NIK60203.1 NAD(P)-dependent dehydrogenase (short-subunit alcohol dehydrogenase family) [Kribbella shirazensis]
MKASFDATDEVVVITGGAQGIGAALAAAVNAAGGTAVVLDVTAPADDVEHIKVDVADRAAVETAVAGVVERYGRIDGLVAGAAVQPRSTVLEHDPSEWTRTLQVNLDGVVWACQAVVPHMVARRSGSVVVFTSGMASTGYPGAAAYAASKAALVAFAKSLAAEVAADRVRVNVVAPGVIDTEQFRGANAGADREHWQDTIGIGDPEDVVGPLLFLLSDAAAMTGSSLTRERAFGKLTSFSGVMSD